MKRNFLRSISANFLQLVVNQVFGLLVFYLLSRFLTKAEFGELNWTLAVCLTGFSLLSFGLDQVMVHKIAANESSASLLGLYFFHALFTGLSFYGLLVIARFLFPHFFLQHHFLLLLGIAKLMLFFSTPFKQIVTGFERFNLLAGMLVISNSIKAILLTYFAFTRSLTISNVLLVFIAADGCEFLFSLLIYTFLVRLKISSATWKEYLALIRTCLPQAGVVFFAAALARLDWILIGLFLPVGKLAEYGFAYKVFELSTLPLLVIAPLLLPLFSRQAKEGRKVHSEGKNVALLRTELIIAALSMLLLNVCWVPLIDPLTASRYGSINSNTIFILSLAIPLLYLNNFLWTLHFAAKRLKEILKIFAITFLVNLVANCILIPLMGNEGAAATFVLAIFIQTVLYSRLLKERVDTGWQPLFVCTAAAFCSGLMAKLLFSSVVLIISFSVGMYLLLLILTSQIRLHQWRVVRNILLPQRSNP